MLFFALSSSNTARGSNPRRLASNPSKGLERSLHGSEVSLSNFLNTNPSGKRSIFAFFVFITCFGLVTFQLLFTIFILI
ncbi:unnamed protein product [Moneuplotes crassus]|uniref:Uncharacterized protein n=1 Tax=Euplotes crassus TaxID=5936 RepID=A0AAD1XE04_EUPCR|nr:unnamed protein product [Moneuplotes crassus]